MFILCLSRSDERYKLPFKVGAIKEKTGMGNAKACWLFFHFPKFLCGRLQGWLLLATAPVCLCLYIQMCACVCVGGQVEVKMSISGILSFETEPFTET